jgi:hypothetical protein
MEGLHLDVLPPGGAAISLADLLALLPTMHLVAGALLILLAIVGFDFAHPHRGVRR